MGTLQMRLIALILAVAAATPAVAQQWEPKPNMTSATLAERGYQVDGVAGLSWPDGRQAVVTFWSLQLRLGSVSTARCTTFYDASMVETGETCGEVAGERPVIR